MRPRFPFVAVAIGLFVFPSLRYEAQIIDGPDTDFYGFPLPWNSDGIAVSLSKSLYLLPLLIDTLFYAAIGYLLWRLLARRLEQASRALRLAIDVAAWIYAGLAAIAVLICVLILEWHPRGWYDLPIPQILAFQISPSL